MGTNFISLYLYWYDQPRIDQFNIKIKTRNNQQKIFITSIFKLVKKNLDLNN